MGSMKTLKKFVFGIKSIVSNPSIGKYILSNPKTIVRDIYDTIVKNALYGNMKTIARGYKNINLITLDDFLDKYSLTIGKDEVNISTNKYNMTGSIRPYETQTICTLAKAVKAKRIFEIGTYRGLTSKNMSYNIQDGGKIFSLCLPQEQCHFNVGEYVKNDDKAKEIVELLSGDSQTYDFSPYYGSIDLMFVDGSHNYLHVLSDSENAIKCVKNNGFIVWHDFNIFQLANAKAIYETCKKYNLDLHRIDGTSFAVLRVVKNKTQMQ